MRKRLYAAMLAGVLTLSLSAGCMSAMASETEAGSTQLTESDTDDRSRSCLGLVRGG